ncbi:hypothetical protein BLNAU_8516 [Blattamonas nauphoetae]|uniref:Uncharacterized protein n=1 Tax=Blattamonas nauphoetae TaxID=2049346 RepID=A0ABQ9XY94_9EUKA|nr:hypothetical protein BLNAU_8516 [Blattamonas nauphoetae]
MESAGQVAQGLSPRKLLKSIQIRWTTCLSTIRQSFQYFDIIVSILTQNLDDHSKDLVKLFSDGKNLLRLAAMEIVLSQADETNRKLHRTNLPLTDSHSFIQDLIKATRDFSIDFVKTRLTGRTSADKYERCRPFIDEICSECCGWATELSLTLTRRLAFPTETTGLNIISHDLLMLPQSPTSDNGIIALSQHFSNFVQPVLRKNTVVHWHNLKATYQQFYAEKGLNSTQIIKEVLTKTTGINIDRNRA